MSRYIPVIFLWKTYDTEKNEIVVWQRQKNYDYYKHNYVLEWQGDSGMLESYLTSSHVDILKWILW